MKALLGSWSFRGGASGQPGGRPGVCPSPAGRSGCWSVFSGRAVGAHPRPRPQVLLGGDRLAPRPHPKLLHSHSSRPSQPPSLGPDVPCSCVWPYSGGLLRGCERRRQRLAESRAGGPRPQLRHRRHLPGPELSPSRDVCRLPCRAGVPMPPPAGSRQRAASPASVLMARGMREAGASGSGQWLGCFNASATSEAVDFWALVTLGCCSLVTG